MFYVGVWAAFGVPPPCGRPGRHPPKPKSLLSCAFFQTPLTKRPTKRQMLRQTQSMTMAHQTPTAPQPMLTHKIQPERQTPDEHRDHRCDHRKLYVVGGARALGGTRAAGQVRIPMAQWMMTSSAARLRVSGDRVYIFSTTPSDRMTAALAMPWAM